MAFQSSTLSLAGKATPARDWADPALLFAVIVAVLMTRGDQMLADPDTHWHARVGADVWRAFAVPHVDAYSHTFAGAPWIAKEWLSQLMMFAVRSIGGDTGLALAAAVSVGLTFSLTFAWLTARMRAVTAFLGTLVALVLVMPHILARPHIFALLPLFFWTRGVVEALDGNRAPRLWLLGVLVVWANLHNSFTIAYPIAGVLGLEAILIAPAGRRLATMLRWGAFGLAALLAGCVTPYGHQALILAFTVVGGAESLPYISEWDPIGWTPIAALAVGSAALGVGALAAGGFRNGARIACLAMLAAMMVRHVRFLDVYAVVAPLVVAAPLVRRFAGLEPEPADPARAHQLLARTGLAVATVAIVALTLVAKPQPGPLVTPRAALQAARSAGVAGGPLYNSYDYGGFLIAEGVPTFIDGRTDQLFLGGFISTLMRAIKAKEDGPFVAMVERHGATWAIVPTGGDEARHFEATPGWLLLHRDEVASVYVRR